MTSGRHDVRMFVSAGGAVGRLPKRRIPQHELCLTGSAGDAERLPPRLRRFRAGGITREPQHSNADGNNLSF